MFKHLILLLVLLSSLAIVFASDVTYTDPTPEDAEKVSNTSIRFLVFDGGNNITACDITLNGINYSMTYSLGFCEYVVSSPPTLKTDYTFQVHYNSTFSLDERSFTYYPTSEAVSEVPFASPAVIALGLGGLFLYRRLKP